MDKPIKSLYPDTTYGTKAKKPKSLDIPDACNRHRSVKAIEDDKAMLTHLIKNGASKTADLKYLSGRSGTRASSWLHSKLQSLINRDLVARAEYGYYKITELGKLMEIDEWVRNK